MELCGGDGSPWSSPPSPGPVEEEQCLFAISLFTLTFASQSIKQASFTSCLGGPGALSILCWPPLCCAVEDDWLLILLALSHLVCPCWTSTTTHGTMALDPFPFLALFFLRQGLTQLSLAFGLLYSRTLNSSASSWLEFQVCIATPSFMYCRGQNLGLNECEAWPTELHPMQDKFLWGNMWVRHIRVASGRQLESALPWPWPGWLRFALCTYLPT